jgi:hypothetical protein
MSDENCKCQDYDDELSRDSLQLESDTPETDKKQGLYECKACGNHVIQADFARRLERERDEAHNAIRQAVSDFEEITWGFDGDCGSAMIIARLADLLPS